MSLADSVGAVVLGASGVGEDSGLFVGQRISFCILDDLELMPFFLAQPPVCCYDVIHYHTWLR